MIRKYLICGKQLFLSSKKIEGPEKAQVCELLLPLAIYWELEKLFKKADYLNSTSEEAVVVNDLYNEILRRVNQYAVFEKDRQWISERLNGAPP